MIHIKKSQTADTRTCDWSKVSLETLRESSRLHIGDVSKGLEFLRGMLFAVAEVHDFDKLSELDHFHADFQTGFKKTGWWDNHVKVNRHHIGNPEGVPDDVNLIDVLEFTVDCVMAGMARSGDVYDLALSDELLQRALNNTAELLKANVSVADETPTDTTTQTVE